MSTARQFITEAKALGLSESQIQMAYDKRIEQVGEFDPETPQFSVTAAYQALREDIANRTDRRTKQWITGVLSEEELAQEQNTEFYSKFYNQQMNSLDTEVIAETYYNNTSQRQMLETNRRVYNYEPWLTIKPDRGPSAFEHFKAIPAGLFHTGYNSFAGFMAGLREKGAEASLEKKDYTGGMLGFTTGFNMAQAERQQNAKEYREINELKFRTVMQKGDDARNWWLDLGGKTPDYVQDAFSFQLAEGFGQLPFIALGLIPIAGPPLLFSQIAGQYYAEGLEESEGDHDIATAYTSIFAPLGFIVDRFILGAGKGFTKATLPKSFKQFATKEYKKLGIEIGAGAGGEFLTETAESMYLQKRTTGEINMSQALREGLLAFIIGGTGATIFGGTRAAKGSKRVKKLLNLKDENGDTIFTEEEAVEIIDNINEGNLETASNIGVKVFLNKILKKVGMQVNSETIGNTLEIPSQYMSYNLLQLKALSEMDQARINNVLEKVPAFYRKQLEEAIANPSEKSLNALNKQISEFNKELRDNDYTVTDEDVQSDLDIEPSSPALIESVEYYEALSINELAELASDVLATNQTLSENFKQAIENKLEPLGITAFRDWKKSVNILTDQKKAKIKQDNEKSRLEIPEIPRTYSTQEEVDAFDAAFDRFQEIFVGLEVTFRNWSEDIWNEKTNIYLERFEKKYGRPYDHGFDAAKEFVKSQHIQQEILKIRAKLGASIQSGDIPGVEKLMLDMGIKRGKKLFKNVIAATFAYQKAIEVSIAFSKPVAEPTPEVEPTPVAEQTSQQSRLDELTNTWESLNSQFAEELDLDSYNFTQEEMSLLMQYVAYKQGYDPEIPAVELSQLSENAQRLLKSWEPKATEIANKVDELREALGIEFSRVAGFYFPLRHADKAHGDYDNISEYIASAIGLSSSRRGQYYDEDGNPNVLQNPIQQLEMYLRDASILITVGEAIVNQTNIVKDNVVPISAALSKSNEGLELNENDENMLGLVEKLAELQNIAMDEKLDIPLSAYANEMIFSLVSQHESYGAGNDLPSLSALAQTLAEDNKLAEWLVKHGQEWANFVDPHFVVQKMDGIGEREGTFFGGETVKKTKEGNAYGANAELYAIYLSSVRQYKDMVSAYNQKVLNAVGRYANNKTDLNKLSKRLSTLMFGKKASTVFLAKSPQEISDALGINEEIAGIAYELAQITKELSGDIRTGRTLTTDMGKLTAKDMRRFMDLEERVVRGVASEQEIYEYLAYSPSQNKNKTKLTESEKETKNQIIRNGVRALFERQAIDSGDYFAYVDTLINMAGKGRHVVPLTQRIDAWADYLDSKGQSGNAAWWRTRVSSNLRSEMFSFEDSILTFVANTIKKTNQTALGTKLTGNVFDVLRVADTDKIKQGIIGAMGQLQRARINAFLVGNVGWTLTTQPSSLALTIKQTGFSQTFKAIAKLINRSDRESLLSESDVAAIKSKDKSVGGLESVEEFRELKMRKGLREKIRATLGVISQTMESALSNVSYIAGYNYAKENLGLNERDAIIHGDFVAATTQSMYDRMTRNTALNSTIMRFFRPMQSYVFTAMSNALDSFGIVGVKRSVQTRIREGARFILAQRLWAIMWSYIFGDRDEKLFLDPTFNKGTFGSNVPLFGKDIDIMFSELLPWQDPKTWMGDSPPEQFAKATTRILKAISDPETYPNWERETINYMFRYVTPVFGIGANVQLNNLTDMITAVQNDYEIQDIKGKKYSEYVNPNAGRFLAGVLFGTKSIDLTSKDVKDQADFEKQISSYKKREKAYKNLGVR